MGACGRYKKSITDSVKLVLKRHSMATTVSWSNIVIFKFQFREKIYVNYTKWNLYATGSTGRNKIRTFVSRNRIIYMKDNGPIHFILTIPLEPFFIFSRYIHKFEAVPNHGDNTITQFIFLCNIVSYWVTRDGVWIGNRMYWTLIDRNYK
jgi:hypothetical protein